LTATLGVVATVIAIGSQLGGWDQIGWKTPAGHDADLLVSSSEVLEAIEALGGKIDKNQRQWECDEADEELLKLLQEQVTNDTVKTRRQIEKLKKFLDDNDCSDFQDIG